MIKKIFCLTNILLDLCKNYLGWVDKKTFIKNICNNVSKINIFYVKILQWFTYDLTDDPQTNKELYEFFSTFTNKVPYTKNDINYNILTKLSEHIRNNGDKLEFDFVPINAGTVALAFKGTLNAQPIIIKVLRKNIHNTITELCNQITIVQKAVQWIKYFDIYNVSFLENVNDDIFDFLLDYCRNDFILQADFLNESNNIEKFRMRYESCKYIEIPKVYKKYTEIYNDVIVMDYIHGHSIDKNTNKENEIYLDIIHKFIISSYFLKNIYHGDLHLGNIIFMKDEDEYKLGIIDFGLVGELTNILEQNLIYDLLLSYSTEDSMGIMNTIIKYIEEINNKVLNENDKPEILKVVNNFNRPGKSATVTHQDIHNVLYLLQKYKFHVPKRLSILLLSAASQSGSISKLKEHTDNVDLRMIIKNITDNFF